MQRDAALRDQVASALAGWTHHAPDETGLKRAAVALVITDEGPGSAIWGLQRGQRHSGHWSTEAALILTRRAKSLRGHAGQWALPGGRIDGAETPEETALRELQEEVDLQLSPADVLGRLDTFITRSGYAITPVGAAIQLSPTGIFSTGCSLPASGSRMGASARKNSVTGMRWMLATSAGLGLSCRASPAHSTTGVMA